jgi:hypothetical protein
MPKKSRLVKCLFCNGLKDYRSKRCLNCYKSRVSLNNGKKSLNSL